MAELGQPVTYTGTNDEEFFAFVVKNLENGNQNLAVWQGGTWWEAQDAPKRKKGSPDGNGHTWSE